MIPLDWVFIAALREHAASLCHFLRKGATQTKCHKNLPSSFSVFCHETLRLKGGMSQSTPHGTSPYRYNF